MTPHPFAILQRRHERPLPRPPPIRHHQPSRHLLILIVALFSSCLSRYTRCWPPAPVPGVSSLWLVLYSLVPTPVTRVTSSLVFNVNYFCRFRTGGTTWPRGPTIRSTSSTLNDLRRTALSGHRGGRFGSPLCRARAEGVGGIVRAVRAWPSPRCARQRRRGAQAGRGTRNNRELERRRGQHAVLRAKPPDEHAADLLPTVSGGPAADRAQHRPGNGRSPRWRFSTSTPRRRAKGQDCRSRKSRGHIRPRGPARRQEHGDI